MEMTTDRRVWLQGAVERLVREACAAHARVVAAGGELLAEAVAPVPGGPSITVLEPTWLGPFAHALWESPEGAVHLRRLPPGLLLVVAFDQRSSPGLVRVRSLELLTSWGRVLAQEPTGLVTER